MRVQVLDEMMAQKKHLAQHLLVPFPPALVYIPSPCPASLGEGAQPGCWGPGFRASAGEAGRVEKERGREVPAVSGQASRMAPSRTPLSTRTSLIAHEQELPAA